MKYLTCYSRSANTDSTGKARVNVNTANNDQLAQTLTKAGVTGPRLAEALGKVRENKPFKSTVDFYFKLELKIEEFKKISDTITTDARKIIPGLINVNTAPKEVLQCIPGLEAGDADALVAQRSSGGLNTATASAGIAWVLDALSQAKATEAAPFITTGSKRFSAQIVGVSGDGRAFKRARAVFDASGTTPKLLYYKDQSHLGWPLDSYILEQLRTGQYAGQTASGLSGQTGLNSGATGGVR